MVMGLGILLDSLEKGNCTVCKTGFSFQISMLSCANLFPPWNFRHGLFKSCFELNVFIMSFWIVMML